MIRPSNRVYKIQMFVIPSREIGFLYTWLALWDGIFVNVLH